MTTPLLNIHHPSELVASPQPTTPQARRASRNGAELALTVRELDLLVFLLSHPGRAFSRGLAAIWVGIACVVGDALNWLTVARRLREQTARLMAAFKDYIEKPLGMLA